MLVCVCARNANMYIHTRIKNIPISCAGLSHVRGKQPSFAETLGNGNVQLTHDYIAQISRKMDKQYYARVRWGFIQHMCAQNKTPLLTPESHPPTKRLLNTADSVDALRCALYRPYLTHTYLFIVVLFLYTLLQRRLCVSITAYPSADS